MAIQKERKTTKLVVRIQPSLKALAERAAADKRRSFASLVETVLADYLVKEGYLTSSSEADQQHKPQDEGESEEDDSPHTSSCDTSKEVAAGLRMEVVSC